MKFQAVAPLFLAVILLYEVLHWLRSSRFDDATKSRSCFKFSSQFGFGLFYPCRSSRDGGSHDVHAGVSDHCVHGTGRLQASQLRLLLGLLVSKHTQCCSHQ